MTVQLSPTGIISSRLNEVDIIELTKIWLDGRKKYQITSIQGEKVKEIVTLLQSVRPVKNYACGPSTPKYLINLYNRGKGELIGEVKARANLVQVDEIFGYVPSKKLVEILEKSLIGSEEKSLDPAEIEEFLKSKGIEG